jgi:hypothetical protein
VLSKYCAVGYYVTCEPSDDGDMATCTPGFTECYGYPCQSPEAVSEAEIEVIPAHFIASAK